MSASSSIEQHSVSRRSVWYTAELIRACRPAEITLRLSHVIWTVGASTLALALLSLGQDLFLWASPDAGMGRIWRLDVDAEISLPTWLAASVMLVNAIVLAGVSCHKLAHHERLRWHWLCLTIIFAGLSLDEVAALHNVLSAQLSGAYDVSGFFAYAWVIPALVACPLGLIAYIPFILDFEGWERRLLIGSALMFLGGAIGMETVGAELAELHGQQHLSYRLATNLEEALEAFGMVAFLGAILLYARRRIGRFQITIA